VQQPIRLQQPGSCGEKYDDRISYFFPLSYLNALLK